MFKSIYASLFLLFVISNLQSQSNFSVSVNGGYCLPFRELKGSSEDLLDTLNTYLMEKGFNVDVKIKYTFKKLRNLGVYTGFGYSAFSGNVDFVNSGDNFTVTNAMNILSIKAGSEYFFLPQNKVSPYLSADISANFFSGTFKTKFTNPDDTRSLELMAATRFGVSAGGGISVRFNKDISLIVGLKYNYANLIGKDYIPHPDFGKVGLNDNGDVPSITFPTSAPKKIIYMQFETGLSFSL